MSIVAGVAVGAAFVRRQQRLADPLIDLRLFRAPAFTAALTTYTLATFVAFGIFIFIGQYLQLVLGLSPLHAGLWTMPFGGRVHRRLDADAGDRAPRSSGLRDGRRPGRGGGRIRHADAGGSEGPSGLAILVTAFVVYSLGLAPVFTLATDIIVGSAPPERAGAASAISETGSEFGGALGVAILGSIGTAVYRRAMAEGVSTDIPPGFAHAARDTLGRAVAVAAQLPHERRSAVAGRLARGVRRRDGVDGDHQRGGRARDRARRRGHAAGCCAA